MQVELADHLSRGLSVGDRHFQPVIRKKKNVFLHHDFFVRSEESFYYLIYKVTRIRDLLKEEIENCQMAEKLSIDQCLHIPEEKILEE